MTQQERRLVLLLAVESDADPRTAERAMREGIARIKGIALKERLTRAADKLGIQLPAA